MILYPILSVIAFLISGFSMLIFIKKHITYVDMPFVNKILTCISFGLYFSSNFVFLYQMLNNKQSWIILFKCLTLIKNKTGSTKANNKIIILNLSCLFLLALPGMYTIFSIEDSGTFTVFSTTWTIQWVLFVLQFVTTTVSIRELGTVVVETTSYLQQEITLVFSYYQGSILCNRIDDFIFMYKNISILAHQFNKIFGMLMGIFLTYSFLEVLNNVCEIMRIITLTKHQYLFYVNLLIASLHHVSIYYVL